MPAPPLDDLAPLPSLEAWLARHRRQVSLALLLSAIAVRAVLCQELVGGPLPRLHEVVVWSDNAFFQRWGEQLAGGDWLQRAPLHPTYAWMRGVADRALEEDPDLPARMGIPAAVRADRALLEERLWDGWMGGATFYQEPAYPYLVGLTYLFTGNDPWHVFAWQLALGALLVLVVHLLTRRLFCETAALAAGVLALLAPIPLLYEVTLQRDGLVLFTSVALALVMHWARAGGHWRWLALGLAFGAAALVKQSFLFFPAALGACLLLGRRTRPRAALGAVGLVAAGMALALLPVALRNLVVGVPLLAMNGSATAMLAVYHARSASPVDLVVGTEYAHVLVSSGGRLLASLRAAAQTHPDAWGFWALNLEKLLYAFHPYEAPNNSDPYLFYQAAPILRALPATLLVLLPLSFVGLASRRAGAAWPVLVAIAATLPALVLSTVLSRYRAPLVALLLPLSGAGLVRLLGWAQKKRFVHLGATAALTALYFAFSASSPPGQDPALRARRYAFAGIAALSGEHPAYAVLCLREAARLAPNDPKIRARLGQALLAAGDTARALVEVEAAARSFDSSPLRELHARALWSAGRGPEAVNEARAALTLDPGNQSAVRLLEELQEGVAPAPPKAPADSGRSLSP